MKYEAETKESIKSEGNEVTVKAALWQSQMKRSWLMAQAVYRTEEEWMAVNGFWNGQYYLYI